MGDKRIPISEAHREELKALKRGDETYDDVLERLLDAPAPPQDEVNHIGDALADDEVAVIGRETAVVDEIVERLEGFTDSDTAIDADAVADAVANRLGAREVTLEASEYAKIADEVEGRLR